jgi:hypothetical protein
MRSDIVELRDELMLLLRKQTDAWETAIAIGLSKEELRDYEERENRLRSLFQELAELDTRYRAA